MKPKNFRRTLYVRTLAGFLLIWLVLAWAASTYLLLQTRQEIRRDFSRFAAEIGSDAAAYYRNYLQDDSSMRQVQLWSMIDGLTCQRPYVRYLGLFDRSQTLLCFSGDPIAAAYGAQAAPAAFYQPLRCDFRRVLSESQISLLQSYLSDTSAAVVPEAGAVAGYQIEIAAGWMDGDTLLPQRIHIYERRYGAVSYDENDHIYTSEVSSSDHIDTITVDPDRFPNLPAAEDILPEVWSQGDLCVCDPAAPPGQRRMPAGRNHALYQLAQSASALSDFLDNWPWHETAEDSSYIVLQPGLWHETYYLPVPEAQWTVRQDTVSYGAYCTVVCGESYPLREALPVILPVGGVSLVMFLLAALLVSHSLCKTYAQAQALAQTRRETANALAHDLKTPISLIRGYAENLLCGAAAGKQDQYLAAIRDESERMNGMLSQMLEFSRLEQPALPLHPEPLDLTALAGDAAAPYRGLCAARRISLHITAAGTLTGDRALLLRALDNLLANAMAYVPDGGAVTLLCQPDRMTVQNTGAPIPEAILPRIWEPYFRGDAARSQDRHTGLGLAIVHAVARRHGFSPYAQNLPDGVCIGFVHT